MQKRTKQVRIYFNKQWDRWVVDCTYFPEVERKSFKEKDSAMKFAKQKKRSIKA